MTHLGDPKVIAAFVSAVVATIFGLFNIWKTKKELSHAETRFRKEIRDTDLRYIEQAASEHVKLRVGPYSEFMACMQAISSYSLRDIDDSERRERVVTVVDQVQQAIYGSVGVLASHETRETIIRFRSFCINFLDDMCDYSVVNKAAWEVHQMLRYDLGLTQPGLRTAIGRIRRQEISENMDQIEGFLSLIDHNSWEYRGHGKVK